MQQTPITADEILSSIISKLGLNSAGDIESDKKMIAETFSALKEKDQKKYIALLAEISTDLQTLNDILDKYHEEISQEKAV